MLREEKCLEFVFIFDILGEVVPDVMTEIGERSKATSFAVEPSEFEYTVSDEERREREGQ